MKRQHLLISLLGLLLGFLMICGGLFLFLIRYLPNLELAIRALILNHQERLSYFGLCLFLSGLLFLAALFRLSRRRYFLLKMGGVSIEDRVLAHFAEESLQKFFPGQSVACEVFGRAQGKIEIMANIPPLSESSREHILNEIERVLVLTLKKQCQYDGEFVFNVSFHPHQAAASSRSSESRYPS